MLALVSAAGNVNKASTDKRLLLHAGALCPLVSTDATALIASKAITPYHPLLWTQWLSYESEIKGEYFLGLELRLRRDELTLR